MKYPLNKEKWMEVYKSYFGNDYTDNDRQFGEAIVTAVNQAYNAGLEAGRKEVATNE